MEEILRERTGQRTNKQKKKVWLIDSFAFGTGPVDEFIVCVFGGGGWRGCGIFLFSFFFIFS